MIDKNIRRRGCFVKNKQIIRSIIQSFLAMITIFIILEFYTLGIIPYAVKWVTTIVLIVANCVFSHWCGLRNGIDMNHRHNERMNELKKQSFGKIVDMVSEEKTKNKAAE